MKKVLVVLLVSSLALVSLGAKSPDVKVGFNAGYSLSTITSTQSATVLGTTTTLVSKLKNNGLSLEGNVEYGIGKDTALKVVGGVDLFGKTAATVGDSDPILSSEPAGANFNLFLAGQYSLEVSKKASIDLSLGFDMLLGNFSVVEIVGDVEEHFNCALGGALELDFSYALTKELTISAGGRYSYYLVNTNEDLQTLSETQNTKLTNTALRFFGGAKYAF